MDSLFRSDLSMTPNLGLTGQLLIKSKSLDFSSRCTKSTINGCYGLDEYLMH